MIGFRELVILFFLLPLYLLPSILAVTRNHPQKLLIAVVNIFGGLAFGIGWLVALVWCFSVPNRSRASEIEALDRLLQRGVITREEFEAGKRAVLTS
jgi:hypothetical protein